MTEQWNLVFVFEPLKNIPSLLFLFAQGFYKPSNKMRITFKNKARTDEKAGHTWAYVSILKRFATP